jgi:hypothetical protein
LPGTDESNGANLALLLGVRSPECADGSQSRSAGEVKQSQDSLFGRIWLQDVGWFRLKGGDPVRLARCAL